VGGCALSPASRLNETPRMRTVSADRGDEHDDRDDGGNGCGGPWPGRVHVAATQVRRGASVVHRSGGGAEAQGNVGVAAQALECLNRL